MKNLFKHFTPAGGIICAALFIVGSIIWSTQRLFAFINIEGLLIVVGGVMAVAFVSFERSDVRQALHAIQTMFKKPAELPPGNLYSDMRGIIAWAQVVKERGMRDLEGILCKHGISDPFVKYGLNMVVSGYSPGEVRAMMETAADANYERDYVPVDILHSMASHAPAFGMVGTLVGMIIMLCNLSEDIASIGASLSVAFLATLYGVVSARLVYMPAAERLRQEVEKRRFRNQLITEGMVMLVSEKTPMYIQDRLNSFLRPDMHDYFDYFNAAPVKPALIAQRFKALSA